MTNWFSANPKTHLAGKTAIVLGGSSGIGQAAANALAAAGANVVVSGVPSDRCDTATQEILKDGGVAISVPCDATKQEEIDNLVNCAVEAFGGLDIVVSSCGYAPPRQDILEFSREDWAKVFDINLNTNFFLAQTAAKVMKNNEEGGRMVFVASERGILPMINAGPYAITKAAVIGMIKSLCIDLAPYKITVNGIGPGYVSTEMVAKVFEELPQQKEFVLSRTPLKNIGTVDEMAAAILYFCLPQASYTSGQILMLDGGWGCNS